MPANARRRRKSMRLTVGLGMMIVLGACSAGSSASPLVTRPSTQSEGARPTAAATTPVATSAPSGTPAPTANVTTVTIRNRSFGPPEITVAVGKVTFVNRDSVAHTVSEGENGNLAPNARFNVVVAPGAFVEVTFGQPGDYRITCLFHSEMHLLVHAH
jgi:plastocyanin